MKLHKATITILALVLNMGLHTLSQASNINLSNLGRSNQVFIGSNQGARIVGQIKTIPIFEPEVEMGNCRCQAPSDVTIECPGANWAAGTFNANNDVEGAQLGVRFRQNKVWCSYDAGFEFESERQECPSLRTETCDQYCEDQLTNEMFNEVSDNILNCVEFYESQCNSNAIIQGTHNLDFQARDYDAFEEVVSSQDGAIQFGAFNIYGRCE